MTMQHVKVYVRRAPIAAAVGRPWHATVGHDEYDWQRYIGRFETRNAAQAAVDEYLWRTQMHLKLKERTA